MSMKRMTAQQFLQQYPLKKSKFNNKKIEVDGYIFDSHLEAKYYKELKLRKKAGDILFFRLQPKYLLQPSFIKDGTKYRKIEYIADFEVHHLDGSIEVVDVKGVKTNVFRIKEKMFHKRYPHKLTLITKDDF